jgi:hypothetical protein
MSRLSGQTAQIKMHYMLYICKFPEGNISWGQIVRINWFKIKVILKAQLVWHIKEYVWFQLIV